MRKLLIMIGIGVIGVLSILSLPVYATPNADLFEAANKGDIEAARAALNAGADVNAALKGTTILNVAAKRGYMEIVRLLLEQQVKVNAAAGGGFTALMNAAYYGHTELVKLLLAHGADVHASSNTGSTALSLARKKGHTEIVRLIENAKHSAPKKSEPVQHTIEEQPTPTPTSVKQELTPEQFVKEIFAAGQAEDVKRLQQLVKDNPNAAKQVQEKVITLAGQSKGEEATTYRTLARMISMFRSGYFPRPELDRLLEEIIQVRYTYNYSVALKKCQIGLTQARALQDKWYIGLFLVTLGLMHRGLEQYQQALDSYNQALTMIRAIGDKEWEGTVLGIIGEIYYTLNEYQQALDYYEQALAIHREVDNKTGEGGWLIGIGLVYDAMAQYQQALNVFQQALAITRSIGDKLGEGNCLANIGNVSRSFGQYRQALDYYAQALTIRREIGDKQGEGIVLGNTGIVYRRLGQYQQALDCYTQALAILRAIGDKRGEGDSLLTISALYLYLGQYHQTLDYAQQSLAIARAISDKRLEEAALNNIGGAYIELKQYQQGLGYYTQALPICREIGNKLEEGNILANIGKIYDILGQYQQALDYKQQALVIFREIGETSREGILLTNIGTTYINLGQYQKAYTAFQDSLKILKDSGELDSLWQAQGGLGGVEILLNRKGSAIKHFEQALDTIEALRAGLTEKEFKLSFMQSKQGVYDMLIDLLQDLHKKYPEKGYDRKALETFERKQGRVFLEEMGKSGARLFAGLPETIMQKELDLELQLEQTRIQLVDERSKLITEQNKEFIKNLEEQENRLLTEKQALQEQIKTEYPDYYALKYPKPASFAELQQKFLQPGELMLIYNVMEEKTVLWLIKGTSRPASTGDSLQMYTLDVSEEDLQKKVAELRRIMEIEYKRSRSVERYSTPDEHSKFAEVSHDLYMKLIPEEVRPLLTSPPAPLTSPPTPLLQGEGGKIGGKTLYVVPTGPLYALPFEALVPSPPTPLPKGEGSTTPLLVGEGTGVRYLIEDIPISYLSSASLLKTLREAKARRKETAPYPLLAFADPVYQHPPGPPPFDGTQDRQGRNLSPSPNPSQANSGLARKNTPLRPPQGGNEPTPNPSQEGNLSPTSNSSLDGRGIDLPIPKPSQGGNIIQTLRSQSYADAFQDISAMFQGRGKFKELPETAEEAREIKKLLEAPDTPDPLQLREKASRANVFAFNTDERLDDYQYLVFATHGVLPGEVDYINQPALVLSFPEENAYLTMADVFQLQLNAKLVSLSACNTGSGEQVRGEGVMGLTRAFMYAGTPAIGVTLWSVETYSAKELDVGLFEHLKEGKTPVDALRAIKLQMLHGEKGKDYSHPYYWAPFVLFGDGSDQ